MWCAVASSSTRVSRPRAVQKTSRVTSRWWRNARLAAYAGGLYLSDRMNPATPTELANEVRGFASVLTDIGAAATAGAGDSDPDQAARLKDADAANTKIGELCAK